MEISIFSLLILIIGMLIGYIIASILLNVKKGKADSIAKEQIHFFSEENRALKSDKDKLQNLLNENASRIAILETEKRNLLKEMDQYGEDIKELKSSFQKEFEVLANRIFEEKSEKFAHQNKTSLDQIIAPLKERLAEFQKKVEDTHSSSLKENSSLRQELKHLKDMSQMMTDKAENLTNALTNDSKAQGNWGEIILENILESSGLQKDRTYFIQKSFTTPEGKRLQPDVMIQLPDDKWIAIDSKVSLTAYERYVNNDDPEQKKECLKSHMTSLRSHFKGLSGKRYQELADGKNLDFILMFVPVEPAYLLALHGDQNLFNEAYEKGIVMVSPSTLIASLKIIASTWKHEYQNKNTQEIANRGKLLLDKFSGFIEDFEKIGEQLSRTDKTYQDALKKLKDGKGNLISQAKQLEDLGVKSTKRMGDNLTINQP